MTSASTTACHFGRRIDAVSLHKLGAPFALIAVLLAPSIWMLSAFPPLWRDVDAYIQVTQPPGVATILHYGPLYCFAARVPLYLGDAVECLRAGQPLPNLGFFIRPVLTDSGVFLLLLLQHLSLCLATLRLITLTSQLFWIRFTLVLVWALNPLFYAFAHCVGTETLSLILMLLIGATGLRIVRCTRRVSRMEWCLFGILLWLSILTRHINAALVGLLPFAFFLLTAHRLLAIRFTRSHLAQRWQRSLAKQSFGRAMLALTVGISSIVLTNASLRVLCYAAQTPYRSTVGVTFLFRLKFLLELPVDDRNQLLDTVSKNSDAADVKKLIALLRSEFRAETLTWDVAAFKKKAQASLFLPQTDENEQKFQAVLSRTMWAFLYPPEPILLRAVETDFKRSLHTTIPDIVKQLFVATTFYFSHPTAMPQFGSLITFRNNNASRVFAMFKDHPYFHHPKNLSFCLLLSFWLITLAPLVLVGKIRGRGAADLASYTAALTVMGLMITVANCFLTVFQPRFTFPMWELTIISTSVLFGGMIELGFCHGRRKPDEI
jgi:hypothetical protein